MDCLQIATRNQKQSKIPTAPIIKVDNSFSAIDQN